MVQGGLKKVQGGLSPPWHPTSRAYGNCTVLLINQQKVGQYFLSGTFFKSIDKSTAVLPAVLLIFKYRVPVPPVLLIFKYRVPVPPVL